ncbi:B3/4 domain-containing protein [Spiroplasma turonicum]|uniref:B3/B4 tRNA-binding domain-containing protein n=1 Tax=Spiroplasma turonicum TaxID=216946 RepID=A0A0K1P7J8_9MOLU|nr:phenylalanine--tRNA ligase beta subunit-related protein [Spiroplasma turonicum]AKU79882.1 hypothetical protein STURON_00636 [Spiroplasma turonicum]ALX70893.1 tRNA synthetase subunit beta [Spiroplasma turonicum]
MKKFIVDKSVFESIENLSIFILVVKNVKNKYDEKNKYRKLINESIINARKYITNEVFSENKIIKKWRNILSCIKTKKGSRSSIESLLKRVKNNNEINNINPLVDLYNSVSLLYGVPLGGEDLDKIKGDIYLTKAHGGEYFITLGCEKNEPPLVDEVIYKDKEGAICRSLNWREATRTMLSEETINAIFFLEETTDIENAKKAINQLNKLIKIYLSVEGEIYCVNKNNVIATIT